jgi:hypothetical protein
MFNGLQQVRWPPTNIQDTPKAALDALVRFPGSRFSDPEMTWKFEVAPGGIAFLDGDDGLGRRYDDPRLRDLVADNAAKYDITESETLLFGRNFGVTPDVQSSPDETLYVVSLSKGTVYEIKER